MVTRSLTSAARFRPAPPPCAWRAIRASSDPPRRRSLRRSCRWSRRYYGLVCCLLGCVGMAVALSQTTPEQSLGQGAVGPSPDKHQLRLWRVASAI